MRTANVNKLFNKLLECEHEWNTLALNAVDAILQKRLEEYLKYRNRFRAIYERFLVEEADFFVGNEMFPKFWYNIYARPIDDLQAAIKSTSKPDQSAQFNRFLQYLVNEGVSLFSLLLRGPFGAECRYELLIMLAQLKRLLQSTANEVFKLLQEATTICPTDGRAYELLAKYAAHDGDYILSLYWCLVSLSVKKPATLEAKSMLKAIAKKIVENPGSVFYSPSRLKFMKPAKRAALDSTMLVAAPILQLTAHAICGQLSSKSHFKHLDQLAHSRLIDISDEKLDFESLERIIEACWLTLLNQSLFVDENVSLPQCVMLAGLFKFLKRHPRLVNAFLIAAHHLFTGTNYEISAKIYPFMNECLHEFLEATVISNPEHQKLSILPEWSIFKNVTFPTDSLLECLIDSGLIASLEDSFVIRPVYERSSRINRSMKLLTHRLLEARVSQLASPLEAAERLGFCPWIIVDYETLIAEWPEIKASIQENTSRYLISMSLLDQLDIGKNHDPQVPKIIRFIHNCVQESNPSVRLQSVAEPSSQNRLSRSEFARIEAAAQIHSEGSPFTPKALIRFWCEHLKAIRYFTAREPCENRCSAILKEFLNE